MVKNIRKRKIVKQNKIKKKTKGKRYKKQLQKAKNEFNLFVMNSNFNS